MNQRKIKNPYFYTDHSNDRSASHLRTALLIDLLTTNPTNRVCRPMNQPDRSVYPVSGNLADFAARLATI